MKIYCKDCRHYLTLSNQCRNMNNIIILGWNGGCISIQSIDRINKHNDCDWYENLDKYNQSLSDSIKEGF